MRNFKKRTDQIQNKSDDENEKNKFFVHGVKCFLKTSI